LGVGVNFDKEDCSGCFYLVKLLYNVFTHIFSMKHPEISLVIPCFNEGKTIYQNILKIEKYLKENFERFEIIAVNDGSVDNTLSELRLVQQKVPVQIINLEQNTGKGRAVRSGILAGHYDPIMFMDADLAIPIEELEKFLVGIEKGADIAIASRFVPGLKILKPVLWYRKFMEKVFRLARKIVLNNWKIQDTQCGFKVFKKDIARRVFSMATIDRFAFDSEIVFIAKKLGYEIRELPISLQNPTTTSIRFFIDPVNMFFALLKIRRNDLQGKYPWKQVK
jgi:dolichyl-phosphate beta-glucosyltransferase